MISHVVGRGGVLREVQRTGFVIANGAIMQGPNGALAISNDGNFVLELPFGGEAMRTHERGGVPVEAAIMRVIGGRVVQMDGKPFPDTPAEVKTADGIVIPESELPADISRVLGEPAAGGAAGGIGLLALAAAALFFLG